MKRLYIIISGLIIIAILMVMSILQWNEKVEMTTEKAKKELTEIRDKDHALGNDRDAGHLEDQATDSTNKNEDKGRENTTANPSEAIIEQNAAENEETTKQNDHRSTPTHEGKTKSEILSAYRDIFRDLEIQEISKTDQLLVQAKADYVSGKLSKADLAIKYEEAALVLERSADQIFNAIYNQLERDLEKYGHDINAGLEFRSEYNAKKQARLSRVLEQIKNF